MAFILDRNEAAERLWVSTRTIDRYIQSNRIRTRREGKKILLDEGDVEAIRLEVPASESADDYVVVLNEEPLDSSHKDEVSLAKISEKNPDMTLAIAEFSRIYDDAQNLLEKKEEKIQELSYKLWQAETELQNSVNASEYRRTAHLLEMTKAKIDEDAKKFDDKIGTLEKEVQKKNSFIIGLVILFVVILTASFAVFLFQRLF